MNKIVQENKMKKIKCLNKLQLLLKQVNKNITHAHTHAHTHAYTHTQDRVWHACIHVHMHVHTHTDTSIHTCTAATGHFSATYGQMMERIHCTDKTQTTSQCGNLEPK